MDSPKTAFESAEFQARVARAQTRMRAQGLDALFLTTEPQIRYLTGFLTRFWESPTRPWFLIVPASGDPVAVIPSIGAPLMAQSWITDIRTWSAPDYRDDGVSLLADALVETGPRIGVPMAMETHLRMPLRDWRALQDRLPGTAFVDDEGLLRDLRMVKSAAEIARIRASCGIADRAFARLPEILAPGVTLAQAFRRFQILCLEEGADWVPYLAGGAGRDGYSDVISPASDTPLETGDVVMLDTGLMRDGYFCDFDRNVCLGTPDPRVARAHGRLIAATYAGFDAARPGATAADLFHAMARALDDKDGAEAAGRFGHGLGMQLTEPPSLVPDDHTVLEPGMVLTLEPSLFTGPERLLVHEENIVIREHGAEWLSTPAPPQIRVLP
ncbi:M24 family metallopeptidase [Litorisediminicola beolgyonensis]|uniref:M24 family metallopeptidase n=1 Tax=Litorisediminicola beolgyonensis TaxID=1173614 RepID=A0ABW3ZF00_9RHOB